MPIMPDVPPTLAETHLRVRDAQGCRPADTAYSSPSSTGTGSWRGVAPTMERWHALCFYERAAPYHKRRQKQLRSAARPRPEAPPRTGGTGDLGPATAESPARGRAGSPLYHLPSAPPPWRAYSRKACRLPDSNL